MKYLKLFESYGSGTKLVDQLDYNYVEEYFDKHFKNEDFEDIIQLYPKIVWNNIDDEWAMNDVISDEKENLGIEDFWEGNIRDYINGKNVNFEDEEKIFKLYIENEVDLDELENLKVYLKDETDENEQKGLKKQIRKIKKEIKIINEFDLSELLDEMDEEILKNVIREIFDEEEFVESEVEYRYKNSSLEEYVEVYGKIDDIVFGNSRKAGDWDWILRYVVEQDVIDEYNDNIPYDSKEEFIQEEIYRTIEIQEKLLKLKKSNALLLFDLFIDNPDDEQIKDNYDFQKVCVEEYAENYADGNDEDLPEGKGLALKELYDKFGLDRDIEEEYVDYMHYVVADKYNL